MKAIMVWILITTTDHGGIQYSPPVETLADCIRMDGALATGTGRIARKQCVQVSLVKTN